jgi:uncharacterized protein YdcH (DUF465 family)
MIEQPAAAAGCMPAHFCLCSDHPGSVVGPEALGGWCPTREVGREGTPMSETALSEAEVRDRLLASSDEFRRLAAEHKAYSDELQSLLDRPHLSENEKLQEITLKKKKLLLKDQMHSLVQKHRRQLEVQA